MLVDSRGILLFLPRLLCFFLIFFYFSISYFGLLSLLIKFEAFRSMRAFRLDIFSMISLNRVWFTVRFGVPGILLRKGVENRYREYFRRLFGKGHSSFVFNHSYCYWIFLFLYRLDVTDAEDVFWLFSDFFEDILMFLL